MFTCYSCFKDLFCVEGDWTVIQETRRITDFDQLINRTSFDVIYKRADTFGISISAEQNIMHYIETNVYDGRLEITTSPASVCLDYNERPIVKVSSPYLTRADNSGSGSFFADMMTGETVSFKSSGSGDMSIEMIESDDFETNLSGSGDIDVQTVVCFNSDILITGSGNTSLAGECENSYLKITGSGNIYGSNLITSKSSVIISGSGSVHTYVTEYLSALISGSGNIYIKGNPEIDQTITGSGRIIKTK